MSAASGDRGGGLGRDVGLALAWVVVVLVFWFGLFVPSMEPGLRRPIDIDLYGYFHAKFWYGTSELLAGRLPTWNPYEYCGLPFLATAQPAVLYLPKILAYALAPRAALHVFMVSHYLVAGPFAFVALRSLGLGWAAAALGSVTWVFTAVNIDSNYHPNRISCLVWIPLGFASFDRLLWRPGPRPAAALAAVVAICLLAGYPEYAFDMVLCLAVYWPFAARALAREGGGPRLGATVGWLAASVTTALALSALQLLPLIELVRQSARVAGGTATAPAAPTLGLYDLLPHSLTDLPRGLAMPASLLHLPPVAWVLAVIGIVFGRVRIRGALLAVLAMTTALATVARLVLQLTPGFALLRPGYCWVSLWYFPIACMAGCGLEVLLSPARVRGFATRPWLRLTLAGAILAASAPLLSARSALALAVSIAVLGIAWRASAWRTPAVLALVLVTIVSAWTWIPPSIARAGLLHRYSRGEAAYPPEPPVPVGLRTAVEATCGSGKRVLAPWLAWSGAAVVERIELLEGYPEPLVPGRIDRLLESLGVGASPMIGPKELARSAASPRLLDMLNVGCAVLPAGIEWPGIGLAHAGGVGDQVVYTRPSLPRAWIAHRTRTVAEEEAAWEAIHEPTFDPAREVVLEGVSGPTTSGASARVQVEREEAGRVEIALSTSAPGTLVIAQAYYPGWRARVDGAPVDVVPANYATTGVAVPAGEHRVVLAYAPASVLAGQILLPLGLIAIAMLALVGRGGVGR